VFEKISVVFPLSRTNSVHMRFEKEPTRKELSDLHLLIYRLMDVYETPEGKAESDARVKAALERDAAERAAQ
jgi:hypothetical protein